jgi:alpha-tubulin suppressor-like RCC1 family protein
LICKHLKEKNQEKDLNLIPLELMNTIFDKLSLADILRCRESNQYLRAYVDCYLLNELKVKQISCGQNHSLILLQGGRVLAIGSNKAGQLGLSQTVEQVYLPTEILDIDRIEQISSGFFHSILLNKKGEIWVMGNNQDNQLPFIAIKNVFTPQKITVLPSIKSIIACDFSTGLLTHDGELKFFGNKGLELHNFINGIRLLPSWIKIPNNMKIVDVSSGPMHALLLCSDNKIYGLGSNEYGLLGLESSIPFVEDWTTLPIQTAKAIQATSLGSLILTQNSELMVSGINSQKQFGLNNLIISEFTMIAKNIITFAANDFHTIYLNSSHQVFSMGRNDAGQLGIGKQDKCNEKESAPLFSTILSKSTPSIVSTETKENNILPLTGFFKLEKKLCSFRGGGDNSTRLET